MNSNDTKPTQPNQQSEVLSETESSAIEKITGSKYKKYVRFALAALGGVPWAGGVISASAAFSGEKGQEQVNELLLLWMQEHGRKLNELSVTLTQVFDRFESFGDEIKERIESEEYLTLVRKTFRLWDESDTIEKKDMLRKLITNAGGIKLCDDDLIRLFLDWIDRYHEAHFMVIREVYRTPSISRGEIWEQIHGSQPREDSAEADLFKLLISDLSMGRVLRQDRATDTHGNFLAQKRGPRRQRGRVLESAFDDQKPYSLTQLGDQFVHYVMEDLAPQLGQSV